jgi:hypothetical protein
VYVPSSQNFTADLHDEDTGSFFFMKLVSESIRPTTQMGLLRLNGWTLLKSLFSNVTALATI